jgi:serine/threonine-protein kinase HipA
MPDGLPPSLVVERFDIRRGLDDQRRLALEDLCSVLDLPTAAKYDSTMERIVRAVRPLSTAPDDDAVIILKRALFAWFIGDGDMHLKNMALLKVADTGDVTFRSVRIAPLYDSVTTRVFPRLSRDHMALKLNGKDDELRQRDFRSFASTAGISATEADATMDGLLEHVRAAVDRIALPALADCGPNGQAIAEKMFAIVRARATSFA